MPEYTGGSSQPIPGEILVGNTPYLVDLSGSIDSYSSIAQAFFAAAQTLTAPIKKAVRLPQGVLAVSKWLPLYEGLKLVGEGGSSTASYSMTTDLGCVLKPMASFSLAGIPSYTLTAGGTTPAGVLVMDGASGGFHCDEVMVDNLWIDGSNLPTTTQVDGIVGYGRARAFLSERVGVFSMPGRGFAAYQVTVSSTVYSADGWHMGWCHANTNWYDGLFGKAPDSTFEGCHFQNNGQSGTGDGTYWGSANSRFTDCRWDLNLNGITTDAPTSGAGYEDPITIMGGGSQRNKNYGLRVWNSSSLGTAMRIPVKSVGATWDEDGSVGSGHFAAVGVFGRNDLRLTETDSNVGTVDFANGCPQHALAVAAVPGGSVLPSNVVWASGTLNFADPALVSGASAVYDPGGMYPRVLAACDTAVGFRYGGTTVPVNPYLSQAWVQVGTTGAPAFGTGWANSGSSDPLAFRFLADTMEVEIIGDLSVPTFSGTSIIFTLPSGLQPANLQNFPVTIISSTGTASVIGPRIFVGNNGQVTASNIPGSSTGLTTRMAIRALVSLDF
jgi:hypothetical protein